MPEMCCKTTTPPSFNSTRQHYSQGSTTSCKQRGQRWCRGSRRTSHHNPGWQRATKGDMQIEETDMDDVWFLSTDSPDSWAGPYAVIHLDDWTIFELSKKKSSEIINIHCWDLKRVDDGLCVSLFFHAIFRTKNMKSHWHIICLAISEDLGRESRLHHFFFNACYVMFCLRIRFQHLPTRITIVSRLAPGSTRTKPRRRAGVRVRRRREHALKRREAKLGDFWGPRQPSCDGFMMVMPGLDMFRYVQRIFRFQPVMGEILWKSLPLLFASCFSICTDTSQKESLDMLGSSTVCSSMCLKWRTYRHIKLTFSEAEKLRWWG